MMLPISIQRPCHGGLANGQAEACPADGLEAQAHTVRTHVRQILRQICAASHANPAGANPARPRP